jgi:hypothetical protein
MTPEQYDPTHPLVVEQAAVGAHGKCFRNIGLPVPLCSHGFLTAVSWLVAWLKSNKISGLWFLDITLDTVPRLLKQLLTPEQLRIYFQPGYRFRLVK